MSPSSLRRRSQKEEAKGKDLLGRLVTLNDPSSPTSEAYRALRTSLFYSVVDEPPKVITVTSPGPREGKSTVCANLGVVLSQANKRVLLVDCDLRKPVLHRIFGLRNIHGIVTVLAGERIIPEVWNEPLEGLKVITSGPLPPNPAEVLGSRRFSEFLGTVREAFDYVLVDAPPALLVSDPIVIATQADGVLLVLDAQGTRKEAVRRSVRALEGVGADILGTVMNNVKASKASYYGYDYAKE